MIPISMKEFIKDIEDGRIKVITRYNHSTHSFINDYVDTSKVVIYDEVNYATPETIL